MLTYLSPARVSNEQLDALERSFAAAPLADRWTRLEICEALLKGSVTAFATGGDGVMLVSVADRNGQRVLNLVAFTRGKVSNLRGWVQDLKRLAADWACHTIQTTVFDPRLALAIQHCGAEQQAIVLSLEVKDGQ